MNIPVTLNFLRPGEEWSLDGSDYEGLTWLSETTKPTLAELEAAWPLAEAKLEADAEAKATARANAINKLAEFGLDADEISALFA